MKRVCQIKIPIERFVSSGACSPSATFCGHLSIPYYWPSFTTVISGVSQFGSERAPLYWPKKVRSPTTHACAYGSPIGFRLRPLGKVFWRRRPSVCAKSVHGDPSFHWHWLLLLLCAFYVDSLTQQPHRPRHQHGWGTGLHCIATECNYYENNWIQWGRLNTMWVRIHIIRGFHAIRGRRCNFTFIGMLHFCRWDHHSQVTSHSETMGQRRSRGLDVGDLPLSPRS